MTDLRLYTKITSLPESLKTEVIDFIDYISSKRKQESKSYLKKRTFGYAKNSIVLKPGFDDPIEDFKDYM